MKYVVFGGLTGWIGQKIVELLFKTNDSYVIATATRMQNKEAVKKLLDETTPDRVIIAAGLTGRPNVDWCEYHQREVIETNVLGVLTVVEECYQKDIHVTYLGTGCIYEYPNNCTHGRIIGPSATKCTKHYDYSVKYTEESPPNFAGSFYSKTKIMTEELLKSYDNVLTLRIRMPITKDLHPRNFVTKILNYERIVNIPNSMSILPDLLPVLIDMSEKGLTGIYNFCNPGAISHNEIMELYKEIVDPTLEWTNFTLEEQSKILKAGRSNCTLDCSKLLKLYDIPDAKTSLKKIFENLN